MKNRVQRLPTNDKGRDFVVGDLHGCFDELHALLTGVEFNPSVDRLISVGDLIDRGPFNMECIDLLYKPWVWATKGNHEEMMCDTVLRNNQDARDTWLYNGGMWSASVPKWQLKDAAERLDQLPLIIVVGEGATRFNVVHAELKHTNPYSTVIHAPGEVDTLVTDSMIDTWGFSNYDEYDMTWGRTIIGYSRAPSRTYQDPDRLSITYVGHTPSRKVLRAEQQIYLDTGAVYHHTNKMKSELNVLSMACPTDGKIYQYNMMWKTITSFPIAEVERVEEE